MLARLKLLIVRVMELLLNRSQPHPILGPQATQFSSFITILNIVVFFRTGAKLLQIRKLLHRPF